MRLAVLCLTVPALLTYQQWADTAHVPTPKQTIVMHAGEGCGNYGSCAIPAADGQPAQLWLAPEHVTSRPVFLHELGHLYDHEQLAGRDRYRFRRLASIPDTWKWRANPEGFGAEEIFASGYSLCARYTSLPATYETQYGWQPTGREHAAACTLIRRTTP